MGEGGGESTADPVLVVVADLEDSGCLGKLAEWTGARHKKVVGLRKEEVKRGASLVTDPDISILILGGGGGSGGGSSRVRRLLVV